VLELEAGRNDADVTREGSAEEFTYGRDRHGAPSLVGFQILKDRGDEVRRYLAVLV
jgi:hypothetical protein